ncbi:lysylphosphatidylglycerol synthase domain-containing protein [Bauldia sp.]|uniref:lysylphosphatidylglycerol synthase domain-containing protein n=1 Tax=Bauldia sp. TaxID=2575872 RepID=UPI003BACF28A
MRPEVKGFFQRISRYRHYFWPTFGILAVIFCGWLLYGKLSDLTWASLIENFKAISLQSWILAGVATAFAYVALAEYDRIALFHLGRRISWPFVMVTSFTTYALSHNVGASLLSGALIRLRAYGTRGLSAAEVGVLVALTSFTFLVGSLSLGGIVMVFKPSVLQRFFDLPTWTVVLIGLGLLSIVGFYALGSLFRFRPLTIGSFRLYYPRPAVVLRQAIVGPIELAAAAAIIYFCLPAEGNPGFLTVLGIFVASFAVAIVSHAPGGLGVFEFVFLTALDDMNEASVVAALLVFRLFYLLIPFALGIIIVLFFERSEFKRERRERLRDGGQQDVPGE